MVLLVFTIIAFSLLFPCYEDLSTLFSEASNVATTSRVPCYDRFSAWLITIAFVFLAVALLPTMKRTDAAEEYEDIFMNKLKSLTDRIIEWLKKLKPWLLSVLLVLAIALIIIGSIAFSLFPCYRDNPKFWQWEGWDSFISSLSPCCERLSTLLFGFLGILLPSVVALILKTWRRARVAKKGGDQKDKSTDQTTYNDAITHLGHESESVILGGIHSLLDLAKKNSDYRPKVFNILCAHIKTTTATEEYQKKHKEEPSTTIQTLMNLLFIDEEYSVVTVDPAKTSRTADEEYNSTRVDLVYKVCRADLRGAYLAGSILRRARLQDINLVEAQLQNAILVETQLQGALLSGAELQGASLVLAQLQGAHLAKAHLQKAKLQQAEMQGACMHLTELSYETEMVGSDLRGVSSLQLDPFIGFKRRIKKRFGKEAHLVKVVFNGVVSKDKKPNPDLIAFLDQSKAKIDSYTEEEADQWIKEYDGAFRWKNHQD